jgi:hypothetical protein
MTKQPAYKGIVDVAGAVGQFLLNTSENDLIVELLQNELDARSSHTTVRVWDDRLVCEGTGRNIEPEGWKRLKFILAAGGKVAPKRGGIGAKNHGLRVAFWIGDTIHVQSAGKRTQLTTRSDPAKAKFDPGAWDGTIEDSTAPAAGTRISILYRQQRLPAVGIEGLDLPVADAATAERLIGDIVGDAPERLIGVTHPVELPRYTLDFITLRGSLTRFIFRCRIIGQADGLVLLERTAEREDGAGRKRLVLREHGVRFSLKGLREKRHVSWPFRGSASAEGELSWEITASDRPRPGRGTLRYPITYPVSAGALSGHGFHISAPFLSNQGRHAPAAGDPVNEGIIHRATNVAAKILARHLVPRNGPIALSVIHPSSGPNEQTGGLVVAVGKLGGLPIAAASANKERSAGARGRASQPGAACRTGRGPLVFPYAAKRATTRRLAMLMPEGPRRLHPDVPPFVINTFASGKEPDVCRAFRPADAIDRMCGKSQRFPWRSDKQREGVFADPDRVADYLKLLSAESAIVRARAEEIKNSALLPISIGGTSIWSTVEWATSDPPEVPGVSTHKVIHPKLHSIRLLQRGLLKLARFNLDRRLATHPWDKVIPAARERYLRWLVANAKRLKPTTLTTIARHPVFDASDGTFHPLEALCLIREPRKALASHIKMPSASVQSLIASRRSVLNLRSTPSVEECRAWYAEAFSQIAPAEVHALDRQAIRNLDRVEQALQLLLKLDEPELTANIKTWSHRTASKTGQLRPVYLLHLPTDAVAACQLAPDDLLGRRPMDMWKTLGAREHPSDDAILRVIADGASEAVFYRRLAAYLKEGGDPSALTDLPCIRTRVGMKAPSSVAIAGKTSFWGRWKTVIKVGVPERARHLELTGVLPAGLREHDSRAFFDWLSKQEAGVQVGHRAEIRRHWHEPAHGPLRWWEHHDVPCLPVIAGGKLLLVTYPQADTRPVYLPDFPEIAREFGRADIRHGVVDESIHRVFPDLRGRGVRSLRDTLINRGKTTVLGERGLAENRHQETVRLVQIGANRRTLARELDRVGLGRKSLLPECMKVLEQLTEARCAEKIVAIQDRRQHLRGRGRCGPGRGSCALDGRRRVGHGSFRSNRSSIGSRWR